MPMSKRKRFRIPEEKLLPVANKVRGELKTDPGYWSNDDYTYIRAQCGPEYGHISLDDVRVQLENLRKRKAFDNIRDGGHGRPAAKTTPEWYRRYLASAHWQERRGFFLRIWGYGCTCCCSNIKPEVHHRLYRRNGSSVLYKECETDCIVLCAKCHQKFHHRMQVIPEIEP